MTKKIWSFTLAMLLSVGIISCSLIINSTSWWNKFLNFQNIPIAEIINSSENPLVLTPEAVSSHLISISHNLNDRVTIRFVDKPNITQEAKVFSDKFLLNYPQPWLDLIEKKSEFKLKKVHQGTALEDHF
ncbi:MAG: hypothetical protein AAGE84_31840 [Cyanobacteria bacterium P01_G01_bin.39]